MTKLKGALRAWLLAAALSMTTTTAMSVRARTLFARDDTCGDKTYTQCPQAGFPDNFCCKPGTSCISLAGNTTILCCPDGNDCAVIAPIVCNVQLQDAATNPQAVAKTTALTSELPKCGSNCCPFGYTCDGDQNCVKDQDQSQKPAGAAGASSTASSPTSTSASTGQASTAVPTASTTSSSGGGSPATATATPEGDADGSGEAAEGHAEARKTSAIVGGIVGGGLLLAVLFGGFKLWRHFARKAQREKELREEEERKRESAYSMVSKDAARIEKKDIGAPILQGGFVHGRTDFTAKSHPSAHSTPSQAQEAFVNGRRSYGAGDPRSSYERPPDRFGPGLDERGSFHGSAIVPGLETRAKNDVAAKREQERIEQERLDRARRREEYEAQFETLDIGLSPDLALGRGNSQRDTTMTQWPEHPVPGGRR